MPDGQPPPKPDLVMQPDDYTITARDLAGLIAQAGDIFNRNDPVELSIPPAGGLPYIRRLTPDRVVHVAHRLSRPVIAADNGSRRPRTLPKRIAELYLALPNHGLAPLNGITTAVLLNDD